MAPYRTVYPLDEKKIEDCLIRIEEEETQGDEKQEKPFFAYHISERPSPAHSPRSFSQVLVFALCCSNIMTLALAYFLYSGAYCPVVTLRDPFSLVPVSSASTPAAVGPLRDSGALASIRFEQRIFTSPAVNSSFSSSSSSSSHSTPSSAATSPSYFGNPRSVPGIDRAWKELLAGQFFALSADESAPLLRSGLASPPRTRSDPVYAELDVYHSLSCLNSVRMQLDAEYYAAHGAQDGIGWRKWDDGRARVDACLDRLRQTIMCSADLTVLPLHSSRNAHSSNNNNNNNPQTPHQLPKTCRRWDDVKSWVDRRHERTRFLEVRRQGGL
ncbi:hypothetical protein IWX49DRAFT_363553 [Phyllosticta citricarpa]|uniref:Uncharacterized protein n=1 Tax=Phyllosticta citricarpa TaxID=55181 RepID=A0ABR1MJD9_9PEZI